MVIGTTTALILAATAAAVAAAGTISSGIAAKKQGKAQARAIEQQSRAQADIQRQQAEREREIAAQNELDFRKQQRRAAARARAEGGARGIDLSSGSSLLAAEDFASEVEQQALRIREGGNIRATRLQQQAALNEAAGKSQASLARAQGRSAFTGSLFSAGSTLISAGLDAADRRGLILDQ